MDVIVLCGLDAFFMQFLVRDVTIGDKEVCHEVNDGALKNSYILIYLGREDRLVQGFLDLVDDRALNTVGLMQVRDGYVVAPEIFCDLCGCTCVFISEFIWLNGAN